MRISVHSPLIPASRVLSILLTAILRIDPASCRCSARYANHLVLAYTYQLTTYLFADNSKPTKLRQRCQAHCEQSTRPPKGTIRARESRWPTSGGARIWDKYNYHLLLRKVTSRCVKGVRREAHLRQPRKSGGLQDILIAGHLAIRQYSPKARLRRGRNSRNGRASTMEMCLHIESQTHLQENELRRSL